MKQEAILLDLLRVVSHHRARLATPIRTVQKIYSEPDLENVPFADSIFTRSRGTTNRPYLLIEPSYKINGDDKTKASSRSVRTNEDKEAQAEAASTSDSKADAKAGLTASLDSKSDDQVGVTSNSKSSTSSKNSEVSTPDLQIRTLESDGLSLKDKSTEYAAAVDSKNMSSRDETSKKLASTSSEPGSGKTDVPLTGLQAKQNSERSNSSSSVTTPPLEENIVLGVALEGSKRTLPIEEDMIVSPPAESKELAAHNSGGLPPASKDMKDSGIPSAAP